MRRLTNELGASLVELAAAMLIGSIILTTAYQANRYFSQGASREKDKSLFQQDIINISEMLERDVRIAGYGVPGSGVLIANVSSTCDSLIMFVNDPPQQTRLAVTANPADSILYVLDATGVRAGQWVCCKGSGDTLFMRIINVGMSIPGPDTLYLPGPSGAGPFDVSQTDVYCISRVCYTIESDGSVQKLYRKKNGSSAGVSSRINSFKVTAKDANGNALSAPYDSMRTLSVSLGGYIGKGTSSTLQIQNVEVALRNRL